MRYLSLILVIVSLISYSSIKFKEYMTYTDNVVVSHRGAWKNKELPENSIASLKHAIVLNCTGSAFDVIMTIDQLSV